MPLLPVEWCAPPELELDALTAFAAPFPAGFLVSLSLYRILSPSRNLLPMASLMERQWPSETMVSSEVRREETSPA